MFLKDSRQENVLHCKLTAAPVEIYRRIYHTVQRQAREGRWRGID